VPIRRFMSVQSVSGVVLLAAAVTALIVANSPLAWMYERVLQTEMQVRVGSLDLHKPLLHWINDGLMAVFFLLVGLEIKRELLEGELATRSKAILPVIAACGGMIVPAAIYATLNWNDPSTLAGWAIPCATDIAFALGVLALLGSRVPLPLKVFLTAVAILDDLGAIVIIALFYTSDLVVTSMLLALPCVVGLWVLNRVGVTAYAPYVLLGIALWVCVLKSGVHATLAGVVLALAIPITSSNESRPSPLRQMERALHPWVAFMVMPIFAFANAGVSFAGLSFGYLLEPVPLGIAAGLLLGKQAGVFGFTWLGVKLGWAERPQGTSWSQLYGVALLAGIGFTMSLFIGALAFSDAQHAVSLRVGVLAGSIVSGAAGYLALRLATRPELSRARDGALLPQQALSQGSRPL